MSTNQPSGSQTDLSTLPVNWRSLATLGTILAIGAILVLPLPHPIRLFVAPLLTFFLPGWVVLNCLRLPLACLFERLMLAIGLSYAATVLVSLGLLYVLGTLSAGPLLGALGLGSLVLAVAGHWRNNPPPQNRLHLTGRDVLYLCLCLSVAAGFTLVNLDYADYWGDEMNGLLRAIAVAGGRADTIFEHTKGPVEILVPAAFGLLVGRFDPFTVRLPFALAHVAGVGAFYLLIRRMFRANVALLAAALLALNGLYLAFGRIVQYQAVVFLTTIVAVLLCYAFYRDGGIVRLASAAVLSGIGALAHYDALAVVPVLAFLVWRRYVEHPSEWRTQRWQVVFSTMAAAGVGALFYYPYLLHPRVSETAAYLGRVIGANKWPANNFDELYTFSVLYNSVYYVVAIGAALVFQISRDTVRAGKGRASRARVVGVIAGLAFASFIALVMDASRYLPLTLFALWLVYVVTAPHLVTELKAAHLWMGVAFLGYVFFVDHPRTHLQMIFPAATVLAVLGGGHIVNNLRNRLLIGVQTWLGQVLIGILPVLLLVLFGGYQYLLFVDTQVEYFLTYPEHKSHLYWEDPNFPFGSRRPYGTPHRLGWQMVNRLFLDGTLQGDWDSNDSGSNLFWYTLGWPRNPCYPRYFFATTFQQKAREPDATSPAFSMERYARIGQVWNRDRLQMDVYEFAPTGDARQLVVWSEPEHYDSFVTVSDFRTLPYTEPSPEITMPLAEPVVFRPGPAALQQIAAHYGDGRITAVQDRVALTGYDLDLRWNSPGGVAVVTLYWQAIEMVNLPYKVFVHLEDSTERTWAQADDFPACGTRSTQSWRIGQVVADRHVVALPADILPGAYVLRVGLYEPQTELRMDWLDALGNPQGTAYRLTTVSVSRASTQPAPD